MAQTVEADMLPLEGDVFQNGMEYIEKDVKEKWKERERAGEYMQFWWHDDSYHFFYMIGQEVPKDAGRKSEKKRIDFGASDYAVFTLKEQYWDKQAPDMIKMLIKYALCDWIKQSEMHYDNRKMYFISFENGLYSVYLPLEKRMHSDYVMKNKKEEKKIYGVDEWISYIDEHITEDITPEMMAEHFNYSRDYFRKAFQDDFGMGLSAYISQRKIQKAARELRQGVKVASLAKKYGFKSRNGFDKAFRKAFCTSPSKYAKANTEVVDLNQFYSEYKDKMKVSFMDVDDIKMVGWTIIPNRGREVDIPAQVAFWLDEDSPYFKKMNSVAGSTNGNDKIAMWYHDPECINIQYILGPVVNNFTNVPDDAVKIEIAAGRFAVFETDRESDVDNLADTIRMFSRCVFYGWIKEHRDMVSLQNFTFERYINKKVYIYVPISVK